MARRILRLPDIEQRTGVPIATLRWYRHRGIGPKTVPAGRPGRRLRGRRGCVGQPGSADGSIQRRMSASPP
jgi:hypothetical protein